MTLTGKDAEDFVNEVHREHEQIAAKQLARAKAEAVTHGKAVRPSEARDAGRSGSNDRRRRTRAHVRVHVLR